MVIATAALVACGATAPRSPAPPPPRTVEVIDGIAIRPEVEADHVEHLQALLDQAQYFDCTVFAENVALARFPRSSGVRERYALCLWKLGDHAAAAAEAEIVLRQRPHAYRMHRLLGERYYGRDSSRAASHFHLYMRDRPARLASDDASALVKLGFARLHDGAFEAALETFEQVRTRFAGDPRWVLNADNGLCAAYVALERMDEAIALCGSIVAEPHSIDRRGSVWFNLAAAYHRAGQDEKARRAVEEFLRIQPEARAKVRDLFGDPDPDDSDSGDGDPEP